MPTDPIGRYLGRHAEVVPEEAELPAPGPVLRVCVVIPSLAEGDGIGATLDSLGRGARGHERAEVIVVVNNPAGAPQETVEKNRQTVACLADRSDPFPVHVLDRFSEGRACPPARAGVGTARRTGLDLALRRLVAAGAAGRGALACLDADTTVSPGYLDALGACFGAADAPCLGVCGLRHRLPGDSGRVRAIVAYELWLRYLELGMRLAGAPGAVLTVGSTLVASPRGYALCDGMPRRQAGEDFHFVQKMVKVAGPGSIHPIPGACVTASARRSQRVPFGTGRAMLRCREEGDDAFLEVVPPSAFCDLRRWFQALAPGFSDPALLRTRCEPLLADFVSSRGGWEALARLAANSHDAAGFSCAVHAWFGALQVVRYARLCRSRRGAARLPQALFEVLGALERTDLRRGLPRDPARPDTTEDLLCLLGRLRDDRASRGEQKPCARGGLEDMNSP